jgi:dipeptidyl aminopeptidase/acylaminoacyl peptidase
MMPADRFERQLPALLTELAEPQTPDYFDDLLGLTARTRQRPAWTFLERWLPMVDIARQPLVARRIPLRTVGLGLLILGLLLAAVAAFVVGSRPRVPAPFGPAGNGLVAYAKDRDIYTADSATGTATAVVKGPETDLRPVFSLDGTRLSFERKANGEIGPGLLYVANADGSGLTKVTPEPLVAINSYTFSPDGQEILVSAGLEGGTTILVAKTDGSAIRTLDLGSLVASDPIYRAPDGGEIIFAGTPPGTTSHPFSAQASVAGLYAVKPDGSDLRTILAPTNLLMWGPRSSPDGTQIAYNVLGADFETSNDTPWWRVYVVGADGQAPRLLRDFPPGDHEDVVAWSNDGKRLLIAGCYRSEGALDCPSSFVVVPVDGNGPDVRIDVAEGFPGLDGTHSMWAPDDASIVTTPVDAQGVPVGSPLSWDPLTGRSRPAPWVGTSGSSWQRLAP